MNFTNEMEFLVGAEKDLVDVLDEVQIMPLFQSAVKAGIGLVAIYDDKEVSLWSTGPHGSVPSLTGVEWDATCKLLLEGEPVGVVCFMRGEVRTKECRMMAHLIGEALNSIMANNLKRLLTTEIHTKVVTQSYDELVDTNRQLLLSEKKYRELAENLEIRVQERTEELKRAYARLIQQEKMVSVGQLAAGVAHEINNPNGYILSNLHTLRKYVQRMTAMLEHYRSLHGTAGAERWRELKLDLVLGDIGELLDQSVCGAEKVRQIVSDLNGVSQVETMSVKELNINHEIDRTLGIMAREIPTDTKIIKVFANLPLFEGNRALLCQVFLHLLRNALQARPKGLQLTISTEHKAQSVRITFADNGPGVPDRILSRVFEPFFTTHDVGQGTGLGLTVAYDIVNGYGGTIEMVNQRQGGAAIQIQLPVTGRNNGQVR